MIVVLAYDGLEYEYVKEFRMKNLMQKSFGKTDISEFSEPRTVVIWSSFLAGKNLEKRILSLGKEFWKFKLKPEETFLVNFKKWEVIDLPGFSYKYEKHKREKDLLKAYFDGSASIQEYDKVAFENHKENKEEFFGALEKNYEIVVGYFALADVIGHLSFGIKAKMKLVYKELDDIAKEVKKTVEDSKILVISDHGMKAVGRYGDHNNYGFWSWNFEFGKKNIKISEFGKIIEKLIRKDL